MTKFERTCINYQYKAYTKEYAQRMFEISCDICSKRGRNVPCDRCIISTVHDITMSLLDDKLSSVNTSTSINIKEEI